MEPNVYKRVWNKCDICDFFPELFPSHNNDKKRKREKEEDEVENVNIAYKQMFYGSHSINETTLLNETEVIDFTDHNNLFSCSTLINDDDSSDKYQLNNYYINMINSMLDKPEKSMYCYEQLDLPQNNINNNNNNTFIS